MKRRHRLLPSTEPQAPFAAILVAAFIASIGLDRIDLLAGAGSFTLTPAIILSPMLGITAIATTLTGRTIGPQHPTSSTAGLTMILVLLLGLLISAPASASDRTIPRLVQLVAVAIGSWAAISLVRRLSIFRAVEIGALVGLGVYVVLNVVQTIVYARFGLAGPDFLGILNANITPHGPNLMRPSGGSLDPNRAAYTVATYAYLLLGDPLSRPRSLRASTGILVVCAALTLLTLSRSGIVALAIATGAIGIRIWRALGATQRVVGLAAALGAAIGVAISPAGNAVRAALDSALARFDTTEDGSSTTHLLLLEHGLNDFTNGDLFSIIFGRGYGSSYLYLQSFFPDTPYGNYHSIWITMLVEGGLLAVTAITLLLLVPLTGPRRWLALTAIWFGIFYQSHTDPTFWVQIAVLWGLPGTDGSDSSAPAHVHVNHAITRSSARRKNARRASAHPSRRHLRNIIEAPANK